MQIKLEQLEEGFILYVNGANSERNNCRKKGSSQNIFRSGAGTARANCEFQFSFQSTIIKSS